MLSWASGPKLLVQNKIWFFLKKEEKGKYPQHVFLFSFFLKKSQKVHLYIWRKHCWHLKNMKISLWLQFYVTMDRRVDLQLECHFSTHFSIKCCDQCLPPEDEWDIRLSVGLWLITPFACHRLVWHLVVTWQIQVLCKKTARGYQF